MDSTTCTNTTGIIRVQMVLRMSHWMFPPISIAVNIVGPLLNAVLFVIARSLQKSRRRNGRQRARLLSLARTHNTTYFFTKHLALVNGFSSFSLLPINVKLFSAVPVTKTFCAAITVQRYFSLFLSFYLIAFISAERCWASVFPLNPPRPKTIRRTTAGVWIFCILLSVPLPFLLTYHYVLSKPCRLVRECETTLGNSGIGIYVFVLLCIPVLIILLASVLLLCKLHSVAAVKTYNTEQMVKTFRKAVIVTIATMVSILVSAAPMCVYILTTETQTSSARKTYYSLYVVLSLHVISTPVITILGFQPIKEKFKRYIGLEKRHIYDFNLRRKRKEKEPVTLMTYRNFNTFSQIWISFEQNEMDTLNQKISENQSM